jgi:predicted ATP-dependent endonuclease of OLD family
MYLSRIAIGNFRNFRNLDVALAGNVVIVGENRVGKSNLLYGLRLIFDPSLPDSARDLHPSRSARDTRIMRDTFELFSLETRTIDIVTFDKVFDRARDS